MASDTEHAPVPGIRRLRIDAAVDQILQHLHALVQAERVALARGPEGREPRASVLQQPLAMLDEAIEIGRAVRAPWRDDRRDDA